MTKTVLKNIEHLLTKYSLDDVLKIIYDIYTIYNSTKFFNPEPEKIQSYMKAFYNLILYNENLISKLFKKNKVLKTSSKNGDIIIIELNKRLPATSMMPKLLLKIPKSHIKTDPISYEYYVGLILNKLRINKLNENFALVYGRFKCRTSILQDKLCSDEQSIPNTTHVMYEYIRNTNPNKPDKVVDLFTFISKNLIDTRTNMVDKQFELQLLYILIILLNALKQAQDLCKFTHYDLHLKNILIVELETTQDVTIIFKKQTHVLRNVKYYPYIIDFGRSHVNPDLLDDANIEIKDYDMDTLYSDFKEYQQKIWYSPPANPLFSLTASDLNHSNYFPLLNKILKYPSYIDRINNDIMINDRNKTDKFKSNMFKNKLQLKPNHKYTHNEEMLIMSDILNMYLTDTNKNATWGIIPTYFNNKYDFFRLIMQFVIQIKFTANVKKTNSFWSALKYELTHAYPFYLDTTQILPRPYPSFNGKFNTIDEILEYILSSTIIQSDETDSEMEISMSLNGGGVKKMNEKLISSLIMKDDKKSSQTLKSPKSSTKQTIKTNKQKINFSLKNKYINKQLEEFVMNEDKIYFDSVLRL
jgi:hypothetical protein